MSKRSAKRAERVDELLASIPDVSPSEVAARMTPPTAEDYARVRAEHDRLFASRNIQRPDAPSEPDGFTYTPAVGDNPDALAHQTRLAHAATDAERAAVLKDIKGRA